MSSESPEDAASDGLKTMFGARCKVTELGFEGTALGHECKHCILARRVSHHFTYFFWYDSDQPSTSTLTTDISCQDSTSAVAGCCHENSKVNFVPLALPCDVLNV